MKEKFLTVVFGTWFAVTLLAANTSRGQIVLQQPVWGVFAIRTTVIVPDGGTMKIGGVSNSFYGSSARGVPAWANVPGVNRGFANRARVSHSSASHMSVSAQVISLREMEQEVLAEAEYRLASQRAADPNGPTAVQRKADFISRNVGRGTRR